MSFTFIFQNSLKKYNIRITSNKTEKKKSNKQTNYNNKLIWLSLNGFNKNDHPWFLETQYFVKFVGVAQYYFLLSLFRFLYAKAQMMSSVADSTYTTKLKPNSQNGDTVLLHQVKNSNEHQLFEQSLFYRNFIWAHSHNICVSGTNV